MEHEITISGDGIATESLTKFIPTKDNRFTDEALLQRGITEAKSVGCALPALETSLETLHNLLAQDIPPEERKRLMDMKADKEGQLETLRNRNMDIEQVQIPIKKKGIETGKSEIDAIKRGDVKKGERVDWIMFYATGVCSAILFCYLFFFYQSATYQVLYGNLGVDITLLTGKGFSGQVSALFASVLDPQSFVKAWNSGIVGFMTTVLAPSILLVFLIVMYLKTEANSIMKKYGLLVITAFVDFILAYKLSMMVHEGKYLIGLVEDQFRWFMPFFDTNFYVALALGFIPYVLLHYSFERFIDEYRKYNIIPAIWARVSVLKKDIKTMQKEQEVNKIQISKLEHTLKMITNRIDGTIRDWDYTESKLSSYMRGWYVSISEMGDRGNTNAKEHSQDASIAFKEYKDKIKTQYKAQTKTQNSVALSLTLFFLVSSLIGCTEETKTTPETESKPSQATAFCTNAESEQKQSNLMVMVDLSDRIKTPEQQAKDKALINGVLGCLEGEVKRKLMMMSADQVNIKVAPQLTNPMTYDFMNKLAINFSDIPIAQKRRVLKPKIAETKAFVDTLYNRASNVQKFDGADIYRGINEMASLPQSIQGQNIRNVLFIITDGYMIAETSMHKEGNRSNYIQMKPFRNKTDWEKMFDEKNFGFVPIKGKDFSNLEVCILGVNPKPEFANEFDIIKKYYLKWFTEMGVKHVEVFANPQSETEALKQVQGFMERSK